MKPREGETFTSNLDGKNYRLKKIIHEMVVLESEDGERQILTGMQSLEHFYTKKEPSPRRMQTTRVRISEKRIDLRKCIRLPVIGKVSASLSNRFTVVGRVKDINMEGLSFEHGGAENQLSGEGLPEGSISLSAKRFNLGKMPCMIIYDIPAELIDKGDAFAGFRSRRCGVKFKRLSDDQKAQLECFLRRYTKGPMA